MSQIHSTPGLTFDDVLLEPGYSDFKRQDIDLTCQLTKRHHIHHPLIAAPMDTVCESRLAIALGQSGGLGIIHRNLPIADQAEQVRQVKQADLLAAAAIGVSNYQDRLQALDQAGVDIILLDSAHGYTYYMVETIKAIKNQIPHIDVIAGNVATYAGAEALAQAGADAIRVGMGPGAICTTRIISGMGVPQITAVMETAKAGQKYHVPIIADGGIKYSGDMVKALAAGASTVMMGSYFASAEESPGDVVELTADHVPDRFKSIFAHPGQAHKFKTYRGMGSIGAMKKGTEIKSEEEFHGKSYDGRVLVAEGVDGLVPIKGTVKDLVDQAIGGIKSGMYYVGIRTIPDLWKEANFLQITQASLVESHPHDILVTNSGENYG
jgi:IMP dehydrogenase